MFKLMVETVLNYGEWKWGIIHVSFEFVCLLKAIGDSRLPKLSDREDLSYVNATLHEIQRIATTGIKI